METGSESHAIVQLLNALQKNEVKFMLVGMTAANLQGVMQGTIDVDVWVGLPSRQYMKVMDRSGTVRPGIRAGGVVALSRAESPRDAAGQNLQEQAGGRTR
jgi:hypothetical protein